MALALTLDNRTESTFTISVPFDGTIDSYNLYATGRGQPAAQSRSTFVKIDVFASVDNAGGRTEFTGTDSDYHLASRDQFYVLVTSVKSGVESSLANSTPLLVGPSITPTLGSSSSSFQHSQVMALDPTRKVLVPITAELDTVTGQYRLHVDTKAELEVSDLQIGAVEIKNRDTDDRLIVKSDGGAFVAPVERTNRFYTLVDRSNITTSYPGSPQGVFGFTCRGLALTMVEPIAGALIEYSFDGSNTHGTLREDGLREKFFDFRTETQVFLRRSGSAEVDVEIEAW